MVAKIANNAPNPLVSNNQTEQRILATLKNIESKLTAVNFPKYLSLQNSHKRINRDPYLVAKELVQKLKRCYILNPKNTRSKYEYGRTFILCQYKIR